MSQSESAPVKAPEGEKVTRRRMLRYIGFAAVGAAVVIGAGSVLRKPSSASGTAELSSETTKTARRLISVQAQYLQMPTITPSEEYFVLKSPAKYSDLLPLIFQRHPQLQPMIPTMMVFIDGYYAQASTELKDGDEVYFVPVMAGG